MINQPDLLIDLVGIKMKNPVMNAAGCFDESYKELLDISRLGAIVSKTITYSPREGNPPPRITETSAGMINSIGLQNPGVHAFVKDKLPLLAQFGIPVIVSIAGNTIEEFVKLAQTLIQLAPKEIIAGIEVNVSCPNIHGGNLPFGTDPKVVEELTTKVKQVVKVPVIIKLTPNLTDIKVIAQSAQKGGADIISLINTIKAAAFVKRLSDKKEVLLSGGLSGPCIYPVALRMIAEVASVVNLPIIGMGGIMNASDAIGFLKVGASTVGIGTANFINPQVMIEIIEGIKEHLIKNHLKSVKEIRAPQ